MTAREVTALAAQVAIGPIENWPPNCVAWVESKDEECGKPRTKGYLCNRHHTVAEKRFEKHVSEIQARNTRIKESKAEALRTHGDEWRAELTRIDSELDRRTGMPTTDRAAFGGVGHPQLIKKRDRSFSDSNVKRVSYLLQRREKLTNLLSSEGDQA